MRMQCVQVNMWTWITKKVTENVDTQTNHCVRSHTSLYKCFIEIFASQVMQMYCNCIHIYYFILCMLVAFFKLS